ncbi:MULTISPECIES: hypothetical protein [Vagococcus]|uniref:hypothetical protein n=1 Tax=Vagococcus TaxID=2737 RepID=UPI000E49CA6D|nr:MULTISPECIES: hypothetical protein [Vagococcus]RHH68709.1 hypothetical protein DW196_07690 [Vagococcus sp. AM17-17]
MKKNSVQMMTYAAFLIALGIMIPMIMPVRVVIGPASYTLASHVPVMLAMFVSPLVAVLVALGTAFGFFMTTPFIIGMRALSHVIFAFFGALYLQKRPNIIYSPKKMVVFNVVLGLIHALFETLIVTAFFMTDGLGEASYTMGFFQSVILLVGVGGFVHSLIDFSIAYMIAQKIGTRFSFPVYLAAKNK